MAGARALGHVNLSAPAAMVERLRRFYVDIVGLREGPRPPFRSAGHWLYAGDTDVLHLSVRPGPADAAPRDTGWLDHYAYLCSDLDATRRRLDAAGIPYAIDEVPMLGQVQLFLRDPAGVAIELNFPDAAAPR